jgi:ABC-2 type transport system permease protein
VRWLLLKDLQILRRSPLQAALLVVYPVLIAILVGFAISPDSEKPRVAFLNEVPAGSRVRVGERELPSIGVSDRICERVECIHVKSRREAVEEVESGDALAALILPPDLVDEINSLSTLAPGTPKVEVLVNEENPLKAQAVDDKIAALLAQANLVIAKRVASEGGKYLNLLIDGGEFDVLGTSIEILGLKTTGAILEALRPAVAPGAQRQALDRVIRFSSLARENLDVARPLIERLAQPIEVEKEVVNGDSPPLDIFAIAVAATLTLAFVAVLLVAGSLALEREENAFPRLTRSLVSPSALLAAKIVLGVAVGLVVTLLMLAGLQVFVPLQWDRFGLWLAAIVAGGTALGAAGAALGAAAREVRAVSLLAFMVTLPIAFLSLVPSGAVGKGIYDAIEIVVAVFPFKPALDAMTAALDSAGGSIGGPLLHLAILTVAYALLARFALRRFSAV